MGFFSSLITNIAPIFIVSSPITSYTDQILSIHRKRTSAGFSLDIPLIMLVASILKLFYWLGARFDSSLVLQAVLMIGVQLLLLHVALTHRPSTSSSHNHALQVPFGGMDKGKVQRGRPYDFWQWRSARPYWTFLAYLTLGLAGLELVLGKVPGYSELLGYVALTVEATLPLPQMAENQRKRSCRGFRPSVLGNWLLGDVMKMVFFFNARGSVPWAFKLCGLFQFVCDIYLGVQYWMFGDGVGSAAEGERAKEVEKNGHSL